MRAYRPGDVILLSFPFTSAMEAEQRPALVLLDAGDEDIILARVTSQLPQTDFDVEITDW